MESIRTDARALDESTLAAPPASDKPAPALNTVRDPRDFDAYGDKITLPSFEQVSKAMARALRHQDPWPCLAERARQAEEGRKMALAEGFTPKARPVEEREAQIRAGQSMAAKEAHEARGGQGQPQGQRPAKRADAGAGAPFEGPKKRRSRNRSKPRPGGHASGPKPFAPH